MGEEQVHGRRDRRQDARRHRLRQYRLHRRRPRPRPEDEGHRRTIRFSPHERATELGVEKVELDDLLKRADFITLHTPLTDKTRNISTPPSLKKTKKGVRIINCARGGLVDEAALRRALKSGQVAPAPPSTCSTRNPQRKVRCSACPTSSCTPHLGAGTERSAGKCRAASGRADVRLSAARRDHQCAQFSLDQRRGSAALKPFVALAEKLGSFAGQLDRDPIKEVQITYEGTVAQHEHQGAHPAAARRACCGRCWAM